MYLKEIIEITIGLILVWLVLSLAVMQVQEWLAGLLKWRSNELEKAIRGMLKDPELVNNFYSHPVIKSLTDPKKKDAKPSYIPTDKFALVLFDILITAGTDTSKIQNNLNQIKTYQDAPEKALDDLLNLAQKADIKAINEALKDLKNRHNFLTDQLGDRLMTNFDLRKYHMDIQNHLFATSIDPRRLKVALTKLKNNLDSIITGDAETYQFLDSELNKMITIAEGINFDEVGIALARLKEGLINFDHKYEDFVKENPEVKTIFEDIQNQVFAVALDQIKRGASNLTQTSPDVARTLQSLFTNAETFMVETDKQIAQVRKNVEGWFDDTMDRLSGWYKRGRQKYAFGIALTFALLLNVDSVSVATQLWREPALREAIVVQAEKIDLPEEKTNEAQDLQQVISDLKNSLKGLNIPIGWSFQNGQIVQTSSGRICSPKPDESEQEFYAFYFFSRCTIWLEPITSGWELIAKIGGLLISAGAAMQGAPFWFDVLKKITNVRSSGVKPSSKKGEST